MNRDAVYVHVERLMTLDCPPLGDHELELLIAMLGEPANRAARDLLAFANARTVSGFVTRLVAADATERCVLLTAIRRAIATAE